jgi:hypothetical protein
MLHGVQDSFMLPALDAALLTGRALHFERATFALCRPVAVQNHSVLDR